MPSALWTPAKAGLPPILPFPLRYESGEGLLDLRSGGSILIGETASAREEQSARLLAGALADELGAPFRVSHQPLPGLTLVLALEGTPLALQAARQYSLPDPVPGPEAYRLALTPQGGALLGSDERGLGWAAQTLLELATQAPQRGEVPACRIADAPYKPLRGVHLYLPSRDHLPFFRRLVTGGLARYKLNTLFLEVGAGMRLERHPEINVAWERFARIEQIRGHRPVGPQGRFQDSTHTELAGGRVLEKEEVRQLVEFCADCGVEVIPEIQSLSHVYHLLAAHRHLAELPHIPWPDAYCPSKEEVYPLLFEVMEEYLEVFTPRLVHIGHDEWRAGGLCPRCQGRTAELFAQDVLRIRRFLRERGVDTALWADHLVACHNRLPRSIRGKDGTWYDFPSTDGCEEVLAREAPDLLMLNWSWGLPHQEGGHPQPDEELRQLGFAQLYGNFRPDTFPDWAGRSTPSDVLGAEMSSWIGADEESLGTDVLDQFLWGANLLWSRTWPEASPMRAALAHCMPLLRQRLGPGRPAPSHWPEPCEEQLLDLGADALLPAEFVPLGEGLVQLAGVSFQVGRRGVCIEKQSRTLPLQGEVDSLVLLMAAASPGYCHPRYTHLREPGKSSQTLAFLTVSYTDGGQSETPLRYGEHLAAWQPEEARATYFAAPLPLVRQGEAEPCAWLYACEWINPRPATPIATAELRPAGQSVEQGQVVLDPEEKRHDASATQATPALLLVAATALKLHEG
ncbi:MAG: family 20 glycosylhydrolase [Candidatus Latescibacteria bacterium]|nr:family 20 glycosylhydrolase [Candidatus Latescibacterota bacterium]